MDAPCKNQSQAQSVGVSDIARPGATIVAAGALAELFTINARLSAAEAAGH
jgi:hypothetical protein